MRYVPVIVLCLLFGAAFALVPFAGRRRFTWRRYVVTTLVWTVEIPLAILGGLLLSAWLP